VRRDAAPTAGAPGAPAEAGLDAPAHDGTGAEDEAGLAHIAAVSFIASRATPFGGFWIALAGGVALARAGARLGARRGYGASLAAVLQSVAIIGPVRFSVPLTQALSAPLMGRMSARGSGTLAQALACAAIRTAQNLVQTAFFVFVIIGLEAYAGSYDRVFGDLLALPNGAGPALALTLAALLSWSAFASTVQALAYRRGLTRWRAERDPGPGPGAPAEVTPVPRAPAPPRRFDPRAVAVAVSIAFGLLIVSASGPLVAAVAIWLAGATALAARLERDVVPAGLVLAAILGSSALAFGLVGGLGPDAALVRGARAALLVLVATWLRAATGPEGLREVSRRALVRLRAIPSVDEGARALDRLGTTPRLAAAARALFGALRPVRKRPLPVADAVLGWVRAEAGRFRPAASAGLVRLRARPRDAVLVALAAAPALTLLPA
jgi:hypothetical protein